MKRLGEKQKFSLIRRLGSNGRLKGKETTSSLLANAILA
jgi:hypothetical protein